MTKNPTIRKGGKLFRLRFRVPFPLYEKLVENLDGAFKYHVVQMKHSHHLS